LGRRNNTRKPLAGGFLDLGLKSSLRGLLNIKVITHMMLSTSLKEVTMNQYTIFSKNKLLVALDVDEETYGEERNVW